MIVASDVCNKRRGYRSNAMEDPLLNQQKEFLTIVEGSVVVTGENGRASGTANRLAEKTGSIGLAKKVENLISETGAQTQIMEGH